MGQAAVDGLGVYLEIGQKRVFACAPAWPGWCRSGKTEDAALAALVAYAPRYARVAQRAGLPFPDVQLSAVSVQERLTSTDGSTDFGVPAAIRARDRELWTPAEAERQVALLRATWAVFEGVAVMAPAELRKGPRGGGRDRDNMIDHVLGAEVVYARKIGLRYRQPARDDVAAVAALRDAICTALLTASAEAASASTGWPPRYAARRIAWHVLDHAWEMEDRSATA